MANRAARACVVCDRTDRVTDLTLDEWTIERCPSCGLRVLTPEPAGEQLVEVFEDGSIYAGALDLEAELLSRAGATLALLERSVAPGRLLDVGCGPGFLLRAGAARGWTPTGIDPSPFSVERARAAGFEAHQGMVEDLGLPAASYDAVALMQVIEHVTDPRALLAECRRLLRPGGALVVATPNPASLLAKVKRERFNYWIPPVHCVWYTPRALRRSLARAGFSRVRTTTWSARTAALHDGLDIVSSVRVGRALPYRLRRAAGTALGVVADAARYGSIVESIAIKGDA